MTLIKMPGRGIGYIALDYVWKCYNKKEIVETGVSLSSAFGSIKRKGFASEIAND